MLHIEDERRVAEEGPRCKPRVPQIASPRRGSVVTAATRSRACLFTCSLSNLAIHLYSQIYCPPFPPFSASYFVDKHLFALCISSISMQVKSYQFSSLTEDDEGERRMLLLFYVDHSNYPCFTTRQRLSFYICISPSRGNDFCENERYIFLPFASIRFDWIRGNRGDRLIENKTEEGTRGSLTSRASLAMPPDCSP